MTHQNGAKETSTYEIIDENKRLYKTQLKQDGEVVFTMKLTFTRIKNSWPMRGQNAQHTGRAADSTDPPIANPEPTDPNFGKIEFPEVLAKRTLNALSKNDFALSKRCGSCPKRF